ncbi:MAG TPA: LysR family transcriptional regulator substrate-binding protein [Naasia sp.]
MAEAFTVGVVRGVSADKWARVWRERMPDVPLEIVAVDEGGAVEALAGAADMVFARLPVDDDLNAIPLWEELPVVVAAKDHPVKLFDTVTLADIAEEETYPGWDDATLDIVAAGHGIARMPQSVFRATGRRDVVAREVSDADPTRIALVWPAEASGPLIDEFIGIVRGRTANSSRGAASVEDPPESPPPRQTRRPAPTTRPRRPGTGRSSRKPNRGRRG